MRFSDLSPEQQAELAALGDAAADRFESLDPATVTYVDVEDLSPERALRLAAHRAAVLTAEAEQTLRDAVAQARSAGLSWHAVASNLGSMTAEGVRKRYSHPV
jgi:hypothetical protein